MAIRVVVAADNPSLSLGLTGLEYDVVDVRPSDFELWAPETDEAQVLVIGVEEAADALDIARRADSRRSGIPMLVVAGDTSAWDGIDSIDDLNVRLLSLPITRPSLIAAVEALSAPPVATSITNLRPQTVEEPPPPTDVSEPAAEPTVLDPAADAGEEPPPAARPMVAARSTNALRMRLAQRPVASPPVVEPAVAPPASGTNDAGSIVDGPSPSSAVDHQDAVRAETVQPVRRISAAAVAEQRHSPPVLSSSPQEVRELVTGLLGCVDQLYDVRDAAAAVVEEAAAATGASAGVVMLPDAGVWRVCGAKGVRPLEWRYIVEPDSWMVTTVVDGDRGVIVEDSDIARQRLGGAPLTHHKQVMAAPVPGPRGMIILARDTDPFTEIELASLATLAADAGPVLADALLIRDLARAISEFRALDE